MLTSIVILLCISSASMQHMDASPFPEDSHYSMNINLPDVQPTSPDSYICTAKKLDPREAYIIKYVPDISIINAHHMLLFGCNDLLEQNHLYPAYWNCAHGNLCSRMTIMYGWAKNAPPMELPPDVGFLVGGNSSIHYVILQIHYANPLSESQTDNSGLKLHLTTQRQRYITGIRLLLADSAQIPPHAPSYPIDINCRFEENYIIHPFAYRVHTHKHGVVVSGYYYNTVDRNWTMLAKGNPQWPQAFYPLQRKHTITNDDILVARCTYNTSNIDYPVKIGSSANDEMCNLYLMYYTKHSNMRAGQSPPCQGTQFPELVPPHGSDVPLPPNPVMEQRARQPPSNDLNPGSNIIYDQTIDQGPPKLNTEYIYKAISGWPNKNLEFGQIAAVALDQNLNIVLFHRGSHVWDQTTFDLYHKYLHDKDSPIKVSTAITIESATGVLLHQWGSNLFYMPHGLFIHVDGSYWVTDVALHQVFHFSKTDQKKPILTLGERFVPGDDEGHFCKPASVAVSKSGEIYVADGYCNSRIVRFSPSGKYLSQWGKQNNPFETKPPVGSFNIPHKVVLLEDRDLVCVADRENGRIQCFTMVTGRFRFQIQREEFGGSLYSVAYSKETGLLFAVCGEALMKNHLVRAFVFNVTDQKLLNVFAPQSGTFTRPHDIAVSPNADEAYVCEIGPNVVWRFMRAYHKSSKKVLVPDVQTIQVQGHVSPTGGSKEDGSEEDASGFETSVVIMCLIAIPILCLVLGTVFVRLRRRGALNQSFFGKLKGWWGGYRTPPQDKFNLGSLLNPHRGFDRVSLEESEAEQSDSDVEEYSAVARKL